MEYTLTLGSISATVSSIGAELISFTDGEREYIWQGHPSGWTGKNPNLFPVIARVKPEGILYSGKAYPMPKHGFARRAEFALVEKTESAICFELRESEETLALYPYKFSLRIAHHLFENGFRTDYIVKNCGDEDMYYCVGGHTAFNCPFEADEKFSDWKLIFDETEEKDAIIPLPNALLDFSNTMPVIKEGRFIPLDHTLHDRVDTLIFDGLNSKGLKLQGPKGNGVHMDFSDFPMIAFWTAPEKHAPFICLEPWQGCGALAEGSEEFSAKPHALRLAPNESKILTYSVSIL